MSLTPAAKLLWCYLCDNCDNSGVIDINKPLAAFQIGAELNDSHWKEVESRLSVLENGKTWIPKFIKFQYGELNPCSPPHLAVIKLIQKNNIPYEYPRPSLELGYQYPSPSLKDKDKDKDKEKGTEPPNKFKKPTIEEVKLCCARIGIPESDGDWFWNKCEGNGWTNGGKPIRSWQHTLASWKAAGYLPSQKAPRIQPIRQQPILRDATYNAAEDGE